MKIEKWKFVPGYEGLYMVSNFGRVKSVDRYVEHPVIGKQFVKGKILSLHCSKNGYLQAHLSKDGRNCYYCVHRLVALAFIPNPDNLPQVNHINEDKTDNRVENLEWCTNKENCNHGTRNQRMKSTLSKKVNQYTLDGELVKTWDSVSEAAKTLNCCVGHITRCCHGKLKKYHKFRWEYVI